MSKWSMGLPPEQRKRLDSKRRKRAKADARTLGYRAYNRLPLDERRRLWELVAILRDAGRETSAHCEILRCLADGFLDGVKAEKGDV